MATYYCKRTIVEEIEVEADSPQAAWEAALNADPADFALVDCDWTTSDESGDDVDDEIKYR